MRLEAAAAADSLAGGSSSSQNAIHNHIRLFEPLVIKALKQYTTTTSVQLQKQVLALLAQLVQLRVNYCLLDSDQVRHPCPDLPHPFLLQ